jgi:hypothetical protein
VSIEEQFNQLKTDGNIGFYTHCEIVQIFGCQKDIKGVFNIYTLVIFQDKSFKESDPAFLIDGLISITNNISCGVQTAILSIENAILFFENLFTSKKFQFGNNSECNIGNIKFLDKLFVRNSNSMKSPQLNYILKNNFHNGSYIIEAFDDNKKHTSFLLDDPVKLNTISEKINEIIPLKIANVSDRIGSIIFQFPVNNFRVNVGCEKDQNLLTLYFDLHKSYEFPDSLFAIANNKFDDCVFAFNTKQITDIHDSISIDSSGVVELTIISKDTNLILFHDEVSFIEGISFNSNLISYQNRCFHINNELFRVSVYMQNQFNAGNNEIKHVRTLINKRKYLHQQKDLENSKEFIQYMVDSSQKALADIRTLVAQYGDSGVYLWDPYLSAIDIKNTLYFTPKLGVTLRAITGLRQFNNKTQIIEEMKKEFDKDDKKFLFLNLEVRGKYGNNGYDFHDRFILFPLERPLVWSLGISVNQLGQSHHILQNISNPQHVLNAFNKLWDELDNSECIVWKN